MDLEIKKICCDCKRELPLSEFHKSRNRKDGHQGICKSCTRVRTRKYQLEHPEKTREYARNHWNKYSEEKRRGDRIRMDNHQLFLDSLKSKCVKCGETRPYVIQFHHIDPSTKSFSIGHGSKYHKSKDDVIEEVNKCVCLCANCHKEFHYLYGVKSNTPVEDLKKYLEGSENDDLI